MQNKDFFSVSDICAYLNICPSTLYSWVRTYPDFPRRRKLGLRRNIFVRQEVEDWLASRPLK